VDAGDVVRATTRLGRPAQRRRVRHRAEEWSPAFRFLRQRGITSVGSVSRALVLAGGGVTGIAWEIGVIAGLAAGGTDVTIADLTVGTSAGAAVAAQITSGEPLDALVARQRTPTSTSKELAVDFDLEVLGAMFATLYDLSLEPDARRARVGALALAADTVGEAARLDIIAARLPRPDWPRPEQHYILLTAVDATSGVFTRFDHSSGVALVDAVAASCAVPGIWPPVSIGGRRYMDGGTRTTANADLAQGHNDILILTPMSPAMSATQPDEIGPLARSGSRVIAIQADAQSLAAMGPNPLDPAFRAAALDEGHRQGLAAAPRLADTWSW
jgi:NTE family protein